MKAKELRKRLALDTARIEAKKEKCQLGSSGYVALCRQEQELLLKCLLDIYWSSYD